MPQATSILIVDDELYLRESMAQILGDAGYAVTCACDGGEALHFLYSGRFDLVLLDLRMPGMDGLSFLQKANRLYPDMPVLILTGHGDLPSAVQALRLQARDYIQKPVHPEQLLARIQEVLGQVEVARRRQTLVGHLHELMAELEGLEGNGKGAEPAGKEEPAWQASPAPGRFLRRGRFVLDLETRTLSYNSRTLSLPSTAFSYMSTLVRHAPQPVANQTLVLESQGYRLSRSEAQEMARGWIHQLRKVIEQDPGKPQIILTVRGVGYRLAID